MTKSLGGLKDAEAHVASKNLPEIYVSGSIELRNTLLAHSIFEMRELWSKCFRDPCTMLGSAIFHHFVKQREFVFLLETLDVQVAVLLVLLDQTGDRSFHVPGRSRRPVSLDFV